jgi:chemotaxis regulatin CheY-phosphate phosphatase CheZ
MPDEFGNAWVQLTPGDAVELQDQLLEAATDLDRLGGLLEDAVCQLMSRFAAANGRLESVDADHDLASELRRELGGAVMALQFQDMAMQVISHTVNRIRGVADFLGTRLDSDEGDAAAVQLVRRHCPVAQRQIDAGSVELF